MSSVELPTFGRTRFETVPYASVDVGASKLLWTEGGSPTLVDGASAAMLETFTAGLSPLELAADLQAVFALDPAVAHQSAMDTTYRLRMAALLLAEDQRAVESWRFHYPGQPSP